VNNFQYTVKQTGNSQGCQVGFLGQISEIWPFSNWFA